MTDLQQVLDALEALMRRDTGNTCQHENTHRGGAIWEICDDCGAKWADDRGGKPQWEDPDEWVAADKAINALRSALAAPQPAQEPGVWCLPENETEAMHDAVMAVIYQGVSRTRTNDLWQAYRNALPTPQAPQPASMTVQEVLEAAGGNTGIKATRRDVLDALKMLDAVCDDAAPQPAQENLGTADVWHEGSRSFYTALLLHRLTPEEALRDGTEVAQPSPIKLSSDGAAAVNPDTFWIPITKEKMPIEGARYLLINRSAGMTQVAPFKNDGWYTHYAGMPKFKD